MLAVDFLELLGRVLVVLGAQVIEGAIVELVDRPIRRYIVSPRYITRSAKKEGPTAPQKMRG